MAEVTPFGLLLSDDLLDSSRVTATARACGGEVRQVRSVEALLAAARERPTACVLLDLHHPGLDVAAFVREAGSLSPRPRLIAFGSHVDAARLREARQAGCDQVMPRSQFFGELETELGGWLNQ